MTRSLGHAGAYSIPMGFERDVIPRDPNGKYKIIAGTDGFWQAMSEQDEKTVNASLQNGALRTMLYCPTAVESDA